ncbi:MAG TPA: hypothetical protein VHM91_07675 [Verrucomicrobiales bacterium]|nr:hypothetical protein [Verrucomicrobiales bacterium]
MRNLPPHQVEGGGQDGDPHQKSQEGLLAGQQFVECEQGRKQSGEFGRFSTGECRLRAQREKSESVQGSSILRELFRWIVRGGARGGAWSQLSVSVLLGCARDLFYERLVGNAESGVYRADIIGFIPGNFEI